MVQSRVVLVGGGFVLAVALLAGAAWMFGVRHEGGPLDAVGGATICMPAGGSTDFSHTVGSYRNEAGQDARITSITLLDSDGVLLSDAVLVQQTDRSVGTSRQWPPPNSQLVWSGRQQAAGAKVPPAGRPEGPDAERWDLVLHLRPADDRALARVGGVRVDYTVGSRRYKLTSDFQFVLVRTGQCTYGDTADPAVPEEQRITDGGGS